MSDPSTVSTATPRVVRVFVSSTFRDLHAEREELVKRVFPELRRLCEARGVVWGEVDLRWGIPDEAQAEGRVLPICLAEIERCRPWFIGLLGERYGWVPEAIAPELIETQPWLAEHHERSVTELEILHGVLRNPAMADRAWFYFRDPAYLDTLPEAEQQAGREQPTPEERDRFGAEEAGRRAAARRAKLAALKQRIRASGLPVRENYRDPQHLGELVRADFTALIDRLYPAAEVPEPLDREAAEHEAFARSRAGVYLPRQADFARLDAHAASEGEPLVILGESGVGKSALLANWALRYRQAHPEALLLLHFIGASPYSADWAPMLRRLLGEFGRRLGVQQDIPEQPEALRLAFANALHQAAARGRVVIILDGLNQLEDRDQAPDLVWLPPLIPANIRLIVSTLPGRPLDDLTRRGWPTLHVQPLTLDERRTLIRDSLAQYAKALSPARVERIATAPPTANPLYLQALLEELRLFGVHERLDERIAAYLSAGTIPALYEQILERWEQDYQRERPGLVAEAMSLLWAARRGLSEVELLELLGTAGQPLPRAYWSPLGLAAEPALVIRSGLIGFFHDYLRAAVANRYLPDEAARQAAHRRLADYFAGQPLGPRPVDELPWQLGEMQDWQRLYDWLAELRCFDAAWQANQYEVMRYWAQIETQSPLRKVEAYRPVWSAPPAALALEPSLFRLAELLRQTGALESALTLSAKLTDRGRERGNKDGLAAWLSNQARILYARSDLDGAMALLQQQERLCRELGSKDGLAACLSNQANILRDRGDLDGAMALLQQGERLCRELGSPDGLRACLGNQALILHARGDLDGAMALHQQEERLCRELGSQDGLAACLGNQAVILRDRGDLDGAWALHQQEERLCRELGRKGGLATCLGSQALILRARGDLAGAWALLQQQERLCRELGRKDGLATCLGNQALILRDRGDLDGAMALLQQQERLCRELGSQDGLQGCLGNQALILHARGDLDGAMALHQQQERLCRELGSKDGLQGCLGNQALILHARGDLDGAMALHQQEERLCRELGSQDGLRACLGNQALILHARGDLDGAMALLQEVERLCREMGRKDGLATCLGNQALILHARGDLDGAWALYQQEARLCRELGSQDGLRACLGNQALILHARGDLDGAMALHQQEERLCRELGSKDGLATCLINQASLLGLNLKRAREALPLAEEAYALAVQHGYAALAQQIAPILAIIRRAVQSSPPPPVSMSDPKAGAQRATQLNIQYQQALAAWQALPWWKRLRVKKPQPPEGL